MFQGGSVPTRLMQPMKYPFATACAGCSSFHRYCESPATVALGLNTISAPFSPRARAPSGKWRAGQMETPPPAGRGGDTRAARMPGVEKDFFPKPPGWGGGGFWDFLREGAPRAVT